MRVELVASVSVPHHALGTVAHLLVRVGAAVASLAHADAVIGDAVHGRSCIEVERYDFARGARTSGADTEALVISGEVQVALLARLADTGGGVEEDVVRGTRTLGVGTVTFVGLVTDVARLAVARAASRLLVQVEDFA